MVHCPSCDRELTGESDVEFQDMGAETPIFAAAKRFYLVGCGHCGAAIGSGVAGAK